MPARAGPSAAGAADNLALHEKQHPERDGAHLRRLRRRAGHKESELALRR
jgi:hypothetical protein